MMETLVALAVLVILMGITFVPIASLASSLKMTQIDNYAKSIYQAAQNRLVSMKASGTLVELQTAIATYNPDQKLSAAPSDYPGDTGNGENWKHLYYITSSDTQADVLIMQAAIISQGIVDNGSYIIEMDPVSGEVYGVFYSDSPDLTYEQACAQGRDRASREAAKIGYYGGFSTSLSPDDLPKVFVPVVKFVNHEELYANIDCPGLAAAVLTQQYLTVDITLTGASGGTWTTQLVGGRDFDLTISQTTIQMIVDSTRTGFSFASITGNQIAPGDDVDIAVSVTYDDYAGRRVITETPGTDKANSLFGSIVPDAASGTTTINVSSVRHLNNLHSAVYSMTDTAREAAGNLIIAQTANIDFDAATWKYDTDDINDNAISQISYAANGNAVINPLSSISPIDNGILLNTGKNNNHGNNNVMEGAAINGAGFTISNFAVTGNGNGGTGLFAKTDGAMSDIRLVNMRVTGGDNTGTLVGAHYGGDVSNCTVIDPIVSGGSNTGGLIGVCQSTKITGCSVHLSDVDASGVRRDNMNERVNTYTIGVSGEAQNIGGLIGYVEANADKDKGMVISDSFAAINVNASSSDYVAGFIGKFNTGNANAEIKRSEVSNCYSSGDVKGNDYTAGFIGYLGRRAFVADCYSTSNVTGWDHAGGFVADHYFALVNLISTVTQSESYGRVLRPDGTVDSFGSFGFASGWPSLSGCRFLNQRGYNDTLYYQWAADSYQNLYRSGNSTADSHPYSDTLANHKNDGYAFPFEMCDGLPHYGNWPEFNAIQYNVADGFTGVYTIAQNKASTYYAALPYGAYRVTSFGAWLSSAAYENYYPVVMTMQDDSSNAFGGGTVLSAIVNSEPYSTLPGSGNYASAFGGAGFGHHEFEAGTELTVSVAPATYNVEWLDGDGETMLKTEPVHYGYDPSVYAVNSAYAGTSANVVPSKEADSDMAWKSYCFDPEAAGSTNGWSDAGLSLKDGVLTRTMTPEFKVVAWEQQMLDMMGYGDEGNPSLWGDYNQDYQRGGYIISNLSGTRTTRVIKMNSEGATNPNSAVRWNNNYLATDFGISPRSNSFRMYIEKKNRQAGTVVLTNPYETDIKVYPRGWSDDGATRISVDTRVGESGSDNVYEGTYRLYWGDRIERKDQIAYIIVYDLGRAAHSTADNPLPAWRKAKVEVGYGTVNDSDVLVYYTGDEGNPNTLEYIGDWYDYVPPTS